MEDVPSLDYLLFKKIGYFQKLVITFALITLLLNGVHQSADAILISNIEIQCNNKVPVVISNNSDFCKHGEMNKFCGNGYTFTHASAMHSTVISEFLLYCSKWLSRDAIRTFVMVSLTVGSFCYGIGADMYGRKTMLFVAIWQTVIAGFVSSLVRNVYIYVIFKMMSNLPINGITCICVLYVAEVLPDSRRYGILLWFQIVYGAGIMLCGVISFLIKNWRPIQLLISLLYLTPFFMLIYIPESPKWLLAASKKVRFIKTVEKIIEWNCLTEFQVSDLNFEKSEHVFSKYEYCYPFMSDVRFITNTSFLKHLISLITIWIICALCFYGFRFKTIDISETDIFTNIIISGFMVCISSPLMYLMFQITQNRITLMKIAFLGLCLVSFLCAMHPYSILLQIGTFFATESFLCIYIYTAEYMPTVIRASGLGICASISRIGSALAPVLEGVCDSTWSNLLYIIFACLASVATMLVIFLPEVNKRGLINSYEEYIALSNEEKKLLNAAK